MTGVNVKQFDIDAAKFAEELGISTSQFVRRMSLAMYKNLISRTPRDTGRLQFGWNMTVGKPDESIPPPGSYPTPKTPSLQGLDFRRGAGVRAGNEALGQSSTVYITNGVPYIIYLEEGTPFIAPRKFVANTVKETLAVFQVLAKTI